MTERRFGAQSMTAPLHDVLVKPPGAAFGRAFDDPAHGFLHACDLDVARREHAAFVEVLASLGPTVHVLDEEIDDPDLVYTFDPLLVTDRGAIPLRPGKPNRAEEPAVLERWTTAAGIPTLGRIEPPGTVEGGDTFWLRTCSASGGPCAPTRPASPSLASSSVGTCAPTTCRIGRGPMSSSIC
jgi:N-dimethylarginine dimethylaminohydrolase